MADQLEGRNAVLEALKEQRPIQKILLLCTGKEPVFQEIKKAAQQQQIRLTMAERRDLDQVSKTGHHQGVIAFVPEYAYATLEEVIQQGSKMKHPLMVILDGIEDPHNLGSVLRSAEVFGATGVIIPKRRAVGVTPTVAKVASGALEHMPVVQVSNVTDTIKALKKEGYWIAGGTGESSVHVMEQSLTGPLALVIGSEGKGISRLVKEQCDYLVQIPMAGRTGSLNASVATGILLYEVFRQRLLDAGTGDRR